MAPFRTGDAVWIGCGGRRVEGEVLLASANGRSLMLHFEAILAGCVRSMPVLRGDDGVFRCIVNQEPVEVAPRAAAGPAA